MLFTDKRGGHLYEHGNKRKNRKNNNNKYGVTHFVLEIKVLFHLFGICLTILSKRVMASLLIITVRATVAHQGISLWARLWIC